MTFQLDTSGIVKGPFNITGYVDWHDLTDFVQGYVEAMFSDFGRVAMIRNYTATIAGFRHLAPAAVERIIADCARMQPVEPRAYNADALRHMGAKSWRQRQRGHFASFSPLVPILSDDGLIMLREVGQ